MGAWGVGPFENDDAMDWAAGLASSPDETVLVRAFSAIQVDENAYVEAPEASVALAAAEVIAAALGAPGSELPPEAMAWVSAHFGQVRTATVDMAKEAAARVARRSELRDLWSESNSINEWQETVEDLRHRLTAPMQ